MKLNALGPWYDHDHKKARRAFQRRLMWATILGYFNRRRLQSASTQIAATLGPLTAVSFFYV